MASAPAAPGGAGTLVVAIDGPSGSGKSTVARAVASALGLRYLDTGSMYRALTWLALRERVDLSNTEELAGLAARADLRVGTDPNRPTVAVDGTQVTDLIREREVTNAVSTVAAVPAVRARLLQLQRAVIGDGGVVVEGRDIGTTVAPDAPVKIFLTADSPVRAFRRQRQAGEVGLAADLGLAQAEIEARDHRDSTRVVSPLARAPDAVEIDSTALTADQVVAAVLARCRAAAVSGVAEPSR